MLRGVGDRRQEAGELKIRRPKSEIRNNSAMTEAPRRREGEATEGPWRMEASARPPAAAR